MTEPTNRPPGGEPEPGGPIDFADVFIGECTVASCDRPATTRVFEGFVLCAHHRLRYELGQDEDAASHALQLLRAWRDQATMHETLRGLAEELNDVMDRFDDRYQDARERLILFDRAEDEGRDPVGLRSALLKKGGERPEQGGPDDA